MEVGCGSGERGVIRSASGWAIGFPNWMDILDKWLLGLTRMSLTEADVWSWKWGFCLGAELKGISAGWTLGNVLVGLDPVWSICVFGISKYFSPGDMGVLELRGRSEAMLSGLRDKQMKIRVMTLWCKESLHRSNAVHIQAIFTDFHRTAHKQMSNVMWNYKNDTWQNCITRDSNQTVTKQTSVLL